MKRLGLIICLLTLLWQGGVAQELTVEYNFGYGTYAMGELKDFMNPSQNPLNNVKVTDDFPGYFVNQVKVGLDFKQMHHTGLSVDFMNTVGQMGVSDYSGSFYSTARVKGIRLGAFYRISPKVFVSRIVRPYLQFSAGIVLNNGDMQDKLVVNGYTLQDQQMSLNGINSFVEPAIGARFHLLSCLDLNMSCGYEFDLTKKFSDKSGQYAVSVAPDWSGLRLMCGLIYSIPLSR